MDAPDLPAVLAALETPAGAAAMAADGVDPASLLLLIES